jgi:hypothetical protein
LDAAWIHKDRDWSEYKATERGQVPGTVSGTIADDDLLREQQGLCGTGAHTAGAEEFFQGDEKVVTQDEQIAHELCVITRGNNHKTKTALQGPFALHFYEFAMHGCVTMQYF